MYLIIVSFCCYLLTLEDLMKIFKAFTLAEVLITVAIIGIIAVMATPVLIKNYQRKVAVAQLQEAYFLAKQGIEDAIGRENAYSFTDTKLYKSCFAGKSSTNCKQAFGKYYKTMEYTKYMEYQDINKSFYKTECETYDLTNGIYTNCYQSDKLLDEYVDGNIVVLANGTTFYMNIQGDSPRLTIDTNGDNEPNTFGRDIFMFFVDKKTGELKFGGPRPNAQDIIEAGWEMNY